MDFKFSKGSDDAPHKEPAAEKKNQNGLLVLLLVLLGGFAYLYFFTGLIKPLEVSKPAQVPTPQVVKMPLPARDGDTAAVASKVNDQNAAAVPPNTQPPNAVSAPAVAPAPAAPVGTAAKTPLPPNPKQEPKKVESPKTALAPKAVQPSKTTESAKSAQPPKIAEKKPQLASVADNKVQKAAVAKTETVKAAAEVKPLPEKKIEKPVAKKVAAKPVQKPKKSVTASTAVVTEGQGGEWAVQVGNYVLEEALSMDMGRVRKAGFTPLVKPGVRKKTSMNRLFYAEFTDKSAAQAAVAKLKRHTSDAFLIEQGGKHMVYAGSYLLDARASSEKERLDAAGFPVTLKRTETAIPTQSLAVGPFSDKKAADAALAKLKGAGIKSALVRQ